MIVTEPVWEVQACGPLAGLGLELFGWRGAVKWWGNRLKMVFGKLPWPCWCPFCGSPPVQRDQERDHTGEDLGGREGRDAGSRSLLVVPRKIEALSGL